MQLTLESAQSNQQLNHEQFTSGSQANRRVVSLTSFSAFTPPPYLPFC